jgi:GNAT superfamily N-acetyltransferase
LIRRLDAADMDSAARVLRLSYDLALPTLAGRYTPEQDRWFCRERMFPACAVWGAFEDGGMTGMIAFREGWIDQLYIVPEAQGRGVGSSLLEIAKASFDRFDLWTFQRNGRARRFYEARGFVQIGETDRSRNEEQEPDALYRWMR